MEEKIQLTPRQIDILKAVIEEYINSGQPVGSEVLEKKYNLGVCPATIRNEMVELAKKGYLKKSHFSSGRIPTPLAFRFYINHLLKEKPLSTAEEVSYRNDVWDYRHQLSRFFQEITRVLAKKTHLLALTTTNQGELYYFGIPYLFHQQEFWNIDFSRDFFSFFEEESFWEEILEEFQRLEEEVLYLLGDEEDKKAFFEPYASIFAKFEGKNVKGYIGVMGSKRIDYASVIPQVRYSAQLIEEVLK